MYVSPKSNLNTYFAFKLIERFNKMQNTRSVSNKIVIK